MQLNAAAEIQHAKFVDLGEFQVQTCAEFNADYIWSQCHNAAGSAIDAFLSFFNSSSQDFTRLYFLFLEDFLSAKFIHIYYIYYIY